MNIISVIKIFTIFFFIFISNSYASQKKIIIASTTSTYDSGLLDKLNDIFEKKFDIKTHVLSLGTGQAIKVGQDGNADILLIHHKPSELKFIKDGYGIIRHKLMYNKYILVGPKSDQKKCRSIEEKLKYIYNNKLLFVSRGDDSGTHKKENELWLELNLNQKKFKSWYINIGQGMGAALSMANEKNAYTLSDDATWNVFKNKENLQSICKNQANLINQYGIILVKGIKNNNFKTKEAATYINWIISDDGKKIINNFKINNKQQFFFNHH